MNLHAIFILSLYIGLVLLLAWPLGAYIMRIMEGQSPIAANLGGWLEKPIYRLCGVNADEEMDWKRYTLALLLFSALGALAVYAIQRLQIWLPLNPQKFANVSPDLAFNNAASFVTNTDWQSYVGESTMSYLTQMLAFTVQNFFSAASGLVIVIALIRGLVRHSIATIGNFWVDITRAVIYILLPISIIYALALVSQGSIQNLDAYKDVTTLEITAYQQPKLDASGQPLKDEKGAPVMEDLTTHTQQLAMGPVASQEAIKMLGTNGGGFYNANSAHPYENPTPLANFLQMMSIFLIPAALCYTFGRMSGDMRQGYVILAAMTLLFVIMTAAAIHYEQQGNPNIAALGVNQNAGDGHSGGNMEGKETRFGILESALFAAITTSASCGAVNAMHDSFTPLGGLVPMWLMQFGEVVFGGVGSGLYGMLLIAILSVFVAGLMIGRTPEYLGKKIETFEMKMTSLAILVTPFLVLTGTAIAVMFTAGKAGIANPGPHGFSEILYAVSSAANNNGSAFAGLSANTPFYNILLAVVMWFGRFAMIVPILAIAGSLAAKKRIPVTEGTLPTNGLLFIALLASNVVIVSALTYIPAIALGPVVEHITLWAIH